MPTFIAGLVIAWALGTLFFIPIVVGWRNDARLYKQFYERERDYSRDLSRRLVKAQINRADHLLRLYAAHSDLKDLNVETRDFLDDLDEKREESLRQAARREKTKPDGT